MKVIMLCPCFMFSFNGIWLSGTARTAPSKHIYSVAVIQLELPGYKNGEQHPLRELALFLATYDSDSIRTQASLHIPFIQPEWLNF